MVFRVYEHTWYTEGVLHVLKGYTVADHNRLVTTISLYTTQLLSGMNGT
jgi:hypothetical protein